MSAPALAPITVRRAVEETLEHLGRRPLLVVSDFDGTLSEIVQDPWGARILPLGRRALRALAGRPGIHVAVLSGRTAADVAARVRVGNVTYLGNHGMERAYLPRGGRSESIRPTVDSDAHEAGHLAERLADEVPRLVPDDWLIVERKWPAIAFHFRQAPDVAAAGQLVRAAVDRLDPEALLERFPGRRVLELRPVGSVAKGEALRSLLDEFKPRSVFMLGDDVSDAQAFQVLREARRSGETDGVSVAVQARAEVPAEVAQAADLVLASPGAATRFLSALARRLQYGADG
ncbi:MAG TPA: trehalose-phosphatase [Candidatus Limnocylindria bacterium]|nr:trehalose-phosphatase [Candidatus Limnocylindria bacterium]